MFKKLGTILLGVTLLFGIAACTDMAETEAAGVYVSIDINPSIEFIVDEFDIVVSVNYANEDAEILCVDVDFIGMNIEEAVELFIELATEAGFIDVDSEDNAILITVLGDDNDELVEEIKEKVRNRVMRFMAMRYINGEVLTEEFTQEDLIAQAEELGVTPGKLKLALLAQTIDEELLLDDALVMSVKDLLAIVRAEHQAIMAELTDEEIALRQAKKEVLMKRFRAKLTDHVSKNPQLTDEEIEERVNQIRAKKSFESRKTWEERLDEWKQRVEDRQENTTGQSQGQ